MKAPILNPRSHYFSHDFYDDEHGGHIVDYAQYETSGAVKVWPVETYEDEAGRSCIRPARGHGEPLMSLMVRSDARSRAPEMLAAILARLT